jgi:hypothetical protein
MKQNTQQKLAKQIIIAMGAGALLGMAISAFAMV